MDEKNSYLGTFIVLTAFYVLGEFLSSNPILSAGIVGFLLVCTGIVYSDKINATNQS